MASMRSTAFGYAFTDDGIVEIRDDTIISSISEPAHRLQWPGRESAAAQSTDDHRARSRCRCSALESALIPVAMPESRSTDTNAH